jgi:ADP-L-glycero-D-manno-heptose 6-epimerase
MIALYKEEDKSNAGVLNLGTGKAATYNDLARAVFKALDLPEKIEYIEMPKGLSKQYQYYTEAEMGSFDKIVKGVEFQDIYSGTADYIRNYLVRNSPYY